MLHILESAIRERRVIHFDYFPGPRVIEPHALGYGKDGQLLLRAFQTAGASESGEHANWKLFRIDRAAGAEIAGAVFSAPRPGYRPGDKAMVGGVIVEL